MFGAIFSFEVRRLMTSVSTYVYFIILFAASFFLALLAGGVLTGVKFMFGGEKVFVNSPLLIDTFFAGINNLIGLIIIVAMVGNAVLNDFKTNAYTMIFTTPVSKFDYLFGRFAGALFVSLLLLTAPAFGLMAGYASPWVNAARIEGFMLMPYINTYWQSIIPNALLFGAIFFAVSLIARDIFIIWLSLIIFIVVTGISESFLGSLDKETISALADPFGDSAKGLLSKYWSVDQKNHLNIPLSGLFLVNRIIWLSVAAIVWAVGYNYFSFTASPRRLFIRKPKIMERVSAAIVPSFFSRAKLPQVRQLFGGGSYLRSLWALSVNECQTILRNIYFKIILLFGMLLLFAVSFQIGKIYDTTTFPVTYKVVETFGGTFQLFLVAITIMFSGELVWRARDNRMSNILDALPVPNWVYYTSKLTGLLFMQTLLLCLIMVCGIIVQLFKGYANFEIVLYIQYLFGVVLINYWLLAILAFFVQTLVSNKFLGYFIVALFYIWNRLFAPTVFKQNLFVFASSPGIQYSDMNGFGHAVFPYLIYKVYWGSFAVALAVLSCLWWARGSEDRLKLRFKNARERVNVPSWRVLTVCLLVFLGCGSFIYYNTNVLNDFKTEKQQKELQANFERKYSKYKNAPQPKITDVRVKLDLYPYTRALHATGAYCLQNKTTHPIDSVLVYLDAAVRINKMSFSSPATLVSNDSVYAYRIYKLAQPLLPGDTVGLQFGVDIAAHGFENNFSGLGAPIYNGTFINNQVFMPSIGYNPDMEIADNNDRKEYGLGYRPTANSITDTAAYTRNVFVHDADYVNFEAVVSTVPDQIAVAPGYLQREWNEGGRRYFHYKMDSKILNFYSFLSARYTVKKMMWNNVNLEIYYTKGHEYNLNRMFNGMQKALGYYTANFSPYQHKQVRILEFPRYASFAQSFPNTIPFSESIGFIADVDDSAKDNVDYPFYVVAHEVAHQWFAHQVVGANVEGSNMLSESLAQYGAIMVLEKEYGEERMRKFLHIEMDDYLNKRSAESEKEKPLSLADPGQGYILYQKGGILMHAIGKYIGEDSLNSAMKRFMAAYGLKSNPYPTTMDLVRCIRQSTPDSLQYFITDAFDKIILYDNKVEDAKATKTDSGYSVAITLNAKKIVADSAGKETDLPSENYVEVGIYKNSTTMMQLNRYKLKQGETKLSIFAKEQPYKVVIDPRLLLIDRKLDDNEFRLQTTEKAKPAAKKSA